MMLAGSRGAIFSQISLIVIPVMIFSLIESKLILPAHLKHSRLHHEKGPLDFLIGFQRRIASGKSPLESGRDHFHHTLKQAGMDVRQVLGVLVLLQLVYAGFGIAGHFAGVAESVMFTAWAVTGISHRWVVRSIAGAYRRLHRDKPIAP